MTNEERAEQMAMKIVVEGAAVVGLVDQHLRDFPDQLEGYLRGLDDRALLAAGCYAVMRGMAVVASVVGHEEGRREGFDEGRKIRGPVTTHTVDDVNTSRRLCGVSILWSDDPDETEWRPCARPYGHTGGHHPDCSPDAA